MEYRKKFIMLAGIDAALAAIVLLGIVTAPAASTARQARNDILKDAEAVASISIAGPEDLELVKGASGWTTGPSDGALPVEAARAEAFLKAVDAVTSLEPVAAGKDARRGLGLDGPEARRVTLRDSGGGILCDFTLGSYAPSPGAVYLSLGDGEASFLAASGMASYVLGKRSSWLDVKAWTSPPRAEDVQELSLKGAVPDSGGAPRSLDYTATRSGSGWVSGGVQLDPAKVEALIRALAAIRGDDYAPASEVPEPTMAAAELRLGNGRSLSLSVEPRRDDGRYPATSSQRGRRLYLPAWNLTEAFKGLDELRAAP
jgi:hypothetical protein